MMNVKHESQFGPNEWRYALPGHEWIPVEWQNFKDEIRSDGEWRLVRKIQFKPTARDAKANMERRALRRVRTSAKNLGLSKLSQDAVVANNAMRNLITIIEAGLTEKQTATKKSKLPKFLRAKPGATMSVIREAAELLHFSISLGCTCLMEIGKTHPKILQPLARKKPNWPLMMALHPGYSANHRKFLKSLQLGEDFHFDLDEISRDAVQTNTRKIAESLFYHLQTEWERSGGKINGKPITAFCEDQIIWWNIAKSKLLKSYPEPHLIPELVCIAAPSRKFPAHKKSDILRKIKEVFCGLPKRK